MNAKSKSIPEITPTMTGNGSSLTACPPWLRSKSTFDVFAAAALQGFMAAHTSGGCLVDDLYAKYAYDLADAMLKAREAKP